MHTISYLHNLFLINPILISQFLVFDLWRCDWAKLPRFPPHCPGQGQGRGWILPSASGLCHIFDWRRDSAWAIPINLPNGSWSSGGKGEASRVADGRKQQLLGAKAIGDAELGCNEELVTVGCIPTPSFLPRRASNRPSKRWKMSIHGGEMPMIMNQLKKIGKVQSSHQ